MDLPKILPSLRDQLRDVVAAIPLLQFPLWSHYYRTRCLVAVDREGAEKAQGESKGPNDFEPLDQFKMTFHVS